MANLSGWAAYINTRYNYYTREISANAQFRLAGSAPASPESYKIRLNIHKRAAD
jgi:hypothetical protein